MTFFLVMFALSGILLNHRKALSTVDLPRSVLPSAYRYHNFNNGAIKGGCLIGQDSILLFGSNGLWLTDTAHSYYEEYVQGFRKGADNRFISNVAVTSQGEVFAASTFDIYHLDRAQGHWRRYTDRVETHERITDIVAWGDSLVVQTRSELFVASTPYTDFRRMELAAPEGYVPHTGLMRTIWTLHSGQLFGLIGELVVDLFGIVLILLCITGLILSFFPKIIIRQRKSGREMPRAKRLLGRSLSLHNYVGGWFVLGLLLLAVTGSFLRPPLLIPIVKVTHAPIPLTKQDSPNPWVDKLRMLRYDERYREWIFYTVDGFYRTKSFGEAPTPIETPPSTGFMGPTVMQQVSADEWIAGSFAGLYRWNSRTGRSYDLYKKAWFDPATAPKIPNFEHSVSGYCDLFGEGAIVFDYNRGAEATNRASVAISQPEVFATDGRMSLWHTALETHVGRIYTFLPKIVVTLFIFLSGIFLMVVLISGYIISRRLRRKRDTTP